MGRKTREVGNNANLSSLTIYVLLALSSQLSVILKLCIMNTLLHFLLSQSCRSLRNVSLGGPHIYDQKFLFGWLSLVTSSVHPLLNFALGPLTLSPPLLYTMYFLYAYFAFFKIQRLKTSSQLCKFYLGEIVVFLLSLLQTKLKRKQLRHQWIMINLKKWRTEQFIWQKPFIPKWQTIKNTHMNLNLKEQSPMKIHERCLFAAWNHYRNLGNK